MYARSRTRSPAGRRRGVVLILVLAMMGLLAVIGVSFATFSGQARSGAVSYARKLNRPRVDSMIEFAITQLINDTTNPMSALYGHGLKSDMYGNDATTNGFFDRNPDGTPPTITDFAPLAGFAERRWQIDTNIPAGVDRNFRGWNLRLPGTINTVSSTFEVIDHVPFNNYYRITIAGASFLPVRANTYGNGNAALPISMTEPDTLAVPNLTFVLDGRYRNAFNGPGIAARNRDIANLMQINGDPGNRLAGQFANYRLSGGILNSDPDTGVDSSYLALPTNPHAIGQDEDYDAPDLENWFLALQSADGRMLVPSFHRPGILTDTDWQLTPAPNSTATNTAAQREAGRAVSKILRPRAQDHQVAGQSTFPDLIPDRDLDGDGIPDAITYDVDNDGDGERDSVWLDLGHPVQRSDDGTLYKPLYSFMVLGLNGRIPLNTAGNLNARYPIDEENLDAPGVNTFDEAGMPLFDHASHLGYSPSEINLRYGFQNAHDDTRDPRLTAPADNYPEYDPQYTWPDMTVGAEKPDHHQFDDAEYTNPRPTAVSPLDPPPGYTYRHIPVSLTQLRNLLTGTRPHTNGEGGDINFAVAQSGARPFANSVRDVIDSGSANPGDRTTIKAIPGRWGEPDAVPPQLGNFNTTNSVGVAAPLNEALDRALNFSATTSRDPNTGNPYGDPLNPANPYVIPNPVRPGKSPYADSRYLVDGIDSNYNTYDFYPRPDPGVSGPEYGAIDELTTPADLRDGSGMPILASESSRRFVTPIDPTGNGRLVRYNVLPNDPVAPGSVFGVGPDNRGRVGFFHYFRPPGVPLEDDEGTRLIVDDPSTAPFDLPLANSLHNPYHGYESYRNPAGSNAHHMAAMPFNVSNANAASGYVPRDATGNAVLPTDLFDPTSNQFVGTFNEVINSDPTGRLVGPTPASVQAGLPGHSVHTYPIGGLLYNDPNEMNLYRPDGRDAPFGPTDLEWLYRRQDIDGNALDSRLKDLVPISFVHAADNAARRRLFSIETWDRIDYAFAHDNPNDLHLDPSYDASLFDSTDPTARQLNLRYASGVSPSTSSFGVPTPNVAHGGRRINLNHPLPHSYDPREPVRQKWITETYQLLKRILPPQSIDSPHELAKLGQFVVNIVDFRDPDNAITIWENPDVCHLPARRDTTADLDFPPSIHLAYLADGTADPDFDNTQLLTHYGMEYQPVALNEVLGFQFNHAIPGAMGPGTHNTLSNVLYIELVNMLTEDATGNATDLDLKYWDFILAKEDPLQTYVDANTPYFAPVYVRPDPITGQVPGVDPANVKAPILPDDAATAVPDQVLPVIAGSGRSPNLADRQADYDAPTAVLAPKVGSLLDDGDVREYVLGGMRTSGAGAPANLNAITRQVDAPDREFAPDDWDLVPQVNDPVFANPDGRYFWLYLRRPANPLLPPDPVDNPLVVVDSICFPYSRSEGEGQTTAAGDDPTPLVAPSQPIYSIERPQPFRGGQLVPDPEDVTRPLFIYGSAVQARRARETRGYGIYDTAAPGQTDTTIQLRQTINRQNSVSEIGGSGDHEAWDYFPFNDRDFVSVAELMLVPACPPGLFTKQFVAQPPSILETPDAVTDTNSDGLPDAPSAYYPIPPTAPANVPGAAFNGVESAYPYEQVRTYPYLAHEFFYTSDPASVIDPQDAAGDGIPEPHLVGGQTGAGWHRMLEFFDVPSPVIDAIGPVAQGVNFDWFRQDRRPGLLNPNLIVDEEVFFGLVDDPRLISSTTLLGESLMAPANLPRVVTQVDANGTPTNGFPLANRGFTVFSADPLGATWNPDPISLNYPWMAMKVPFADFLKQRHGGSGFLYAFGNGLRGTPYDDGVGTVNTWVAADQPYRSLSHFDIGQTLLRPATPEPSPFTLPDSLTATDPRLKNVTPAIGDMGVVYQPDPADPGTYYANPVNPGVTPPKAVVPAIPPRRLFQVPDATNPTGTPPNLSNAGVTAADTTDYVPVQTFNPGNINAIQYPMTPDYANLIAPVASNPGYYLGGVTVTGAPDPGPDVDMRRHPSYRTEMIQKLTNLTTPRTHQFAVWVTVGFFEVVRPGDRAQLVPDELGPELGSASGSIVRHRSFFILDRSRATGYDPRNPGDYRDVVVWSRRIE